MKLVTVPFYALLTLFIVSNLIHTADLMHRAWRTRDEWLPLVCGR